MMENNIFYRYDIDLSKYYFKDIISIKINNFFLCLVYSQIILKYETDMSNSPKYYF